MNIHLCSLLGAEPVVAVRPSRAHSRMIVLSVVYVRTAPATVRTSQAGSAIQWSSLPSMFAVMTWSWWLRTVDVFFQRRNFFYLRTNLTTFYFCTSRDRNVCYVLLTTVKIFITCRRLSVCLSVSKITQKRVHGFGLNFAYRQMSGHGRTD